MKKIVFAMIEAGGGHKAPAVAVMRALETAFPGRYDARLMDFIKDIGSVKVDEAHKKSWKTFLEYPLITHLLFQVQDILGPVTRGFLYRTMVAPAVPDAIRFIRRSRPDLIFSTHYFATMALVAARERTGLSFTIVTYQTEMFTFHAAWKVAKTDWYLTASERAAQSAERGGIPREKIRSFPYPIPLDFLSSRRPRAEVAAELGLEPGRKTILFSFGNQGAGLILQFLLALELLGEYMNVIVVTGKNEGLRSRLAANKNKLQHLSIAPVGYVGNMNELIEASDVCFIKPGPATMMECMHSRKPIIFSQAATPCEQAHANYAIFRGVAKETGGNPMLFGIAVKHFLKDEVSAEVERRYDRLSLENGAAKIARFLDEVAQKSGK
jgi:UDP-N-acetylglucosamine:LPS N-acetylglucosamine transferase